ESASHCEAPRRPGSPGTSEEQNREILCREGSGELKGNPRRALQEGPFVEDRRTEGDVLRWHRWTWYGGRVDRPAGSREASHPRCRRPRLEGQPKPDCAGGC